MSKYRYVQILARIAGTAGVVAIMVSVPLITGTATVAQAETVCLAPQHNDPWIGCIG